MNKKFRSLPLISLLLLLSACGEKVEFADKSLTRLHLWVPGDELCLQTQDVTACRALQGKCEPAYQDPGQVLEGSDPFFACVPVQPPKLDESKPALPEQSAAVPPIPVPSDSISQAESSGGCDHINPRFLISKGKGQPKVIVCHRSSKNMHTVVIACPALSAHQGHHQDSLGACIGN